MMSRFLLGLILAACAPLAIAASADGWPQWRHDAARSGATAKSGPEKGGLAWHFDPGMPDPAYDHQFRLCADAAYAPTAAEGRVYVPSNVADHLVALNLDSGEVVWRFVAEGPVRFAPVYTGGNVYFGSDDGYLYCLSARNGQMRWRLRGAPETLPDSRMLVNGRMASRWPLRGAPVLHDDTIYFGAGIWPEEGCYVAAADAATGALLWRSDALSYVKNGMSDHNVAYDLSLPPHGYLAFIDGRVVVPSGRSLAAWFDAATGTMEPYTCFYVKTNPPRGTWHVFGQGQYAVQGGNWFGTRAGAHPPLPEGSALVSPLYWSRQTPENERYVIENHPFLRADTYDVGEENFYTEPVLTATTIYVSEFASEAQYLVPRGHTHVARVAYDRIVARDLTRPYWSVVKKRHFAHGKRIVDTPRLEFPLLWELKSPLKVLAKGGDFLYAGGENTVAAIALPSKGEAPRVAWERTVDGFPLNALISEGALVVATDSGALYCFSDAATPSDLRAGPTNANAPRHPATVPGGYVLQVGWSGVDAAHALTRAGQRRVIVVEPSPGIADTARALLSEAGLYGRSIQVIAGRLGQLELTPYWAEEVHFGYPADDATLEAAKRVLHPYTGTLFTGPTLGKPAGESTAVRRGALEGAADWTHEMAGADNSFAGKDTLVKWPLGVLWYSGDIDRFYTPATHFQHERTPHPLVTHGRMFVQTGHVLHCIDIYTGRYLWRQELPLTPWMRTFYFDSRAAGRETERNYVAADDYLYVVTGKEIHAYDTATGTPTLTIDIPEGLRSTVYEAPLAPKQVPYRGRGAPVGWSEREYAIQTAPEWTGVRLWNNLIFATLGPNLVAVDRHTGKLAWSRKSRSEATTFAIGTDLLFGLDFALPENTRRGPATRASYATLFALDPETGAPEWEHQGDFSPKTSALPKLPNPWNMPTLPTLALNAEHGLLIVNLDMARLHAFNVADGTPSWSRGYTSTGYQQGHVVATNDHLLISGYANYAGFLLDIATGQDVGDFAAIPQPRTCGLIVGNSSLLAYRDASVELYDVQANRMIGFNSMRAGCTTSFFPAGGIMNAPMLAHGCVCNYPMFNSVALYHLPWIDDCRPEIVKDSWENEAEALAGQLPRRAAGTGSSLARTATRAEGYDTIDSTLAAYGDALRLSTREDGAGYAIRALEHPVQVSKFSFSVERAPATGTVRRNGNAFFVVGQSGDPTKMIEFQVYYGGRSSLSIRGPLVAPVQAKTAIPKNAPLNVVAEVDTVSKSVEITVGGETLSTSIVGPVETLTHYGYGGSNVDNLIREIRVAFPE